MQPHERRELPRIEYRDGVLPPTVRVRPGRDVVVVNLSAGGLLVEGVWRFRPGGSVDLHIAFDAHPIEARGRVLRCFVCGIDGREGVRYRAAIVLAAPIEVARPPGVLKGLAWLRPRSDFTRLAEARMPDDDWRIPTGVRDGATPGADR
jgi:hypothetical protein